MKREIRINKKKTCIFWAKSFIADSREYSIDPKDRKHSFPVDIVFVKGRFESDFWIYLN